jgi:hypothetical protein
MGGAEGIRTPDPLDANEVRYQAAPQPQMGLVRLPPGLGAPEIRLTTRQPALLSRYRDRVDSSHAGRDCAHASSRRSGHHEVLRRAESQPGLHQHGRHRIAPDRMQSRRVVQGCTVVQSRAVIDGRAIDGTTSRGIYGDVRCGICGDICCATCGESRWVAGVDPRCVAGELQRQRYDDPGG